MNIAIKPKGLNTTWENSTIALWPTVLSDIKLLVRILPATKASPTPIIRGHR